MKGLGKGVKSFKDGMRDVESDIKAPIEEMKAEADPNAKRINKWGYPAKFLGTPR